MNRIGQIVIIWCVVAHNLWAQEDYIVEPLSLNTNYSNEIFAIPYGDGVIYTSDRRTNVLINRVDTTNQPLFHLYYVPKRDGTKFGISNLLSQNISINSHQVTCAISADGREIYYTVNDESGQRIYVANKSSSGNWSNIRPFPYNRPNYTTTNPSLSPDGKRLFFASNIPGGFGGFDIYVCESTGRGWGQPKNLGPHINTSKNELYPFIQRSGELFFSSSAHDSMGGMDIFSVRETGGVWGIPQRLPEPINSTADDIAYTTDAEGTNGYFASNRAGKKYDLFSFKSLFPVFSNCKEQEENDYTYEFWDDMTVKLDDTATLKYMWNFSDGTVKYGDVVTHTFASTGVYEFSLTLVDALTNEISSEVSANTIEVLDIEQPYITVSDTIQAGTLAIFDASKTYLPDLKIEEYYWIFGDGTRKKGIRTEHVYTMPGVYGVQLGVIGKTKYFGEEEKVCTYRKITVK